MEGSMRALKAVIAEDEPVLRVELRKTLTNLWPELVICAEAEDGVEALRALEEHAPDVLFLDIQMPAYDKYAVAAFEEGAVDYVMKPFSTARLATTVARLKEKLAGAPANLDGLLNALGQLANGPQQHLRWITASQGNELRLITVEEICYFQSDAKYTLVVTPERESLIRRPIKELIEALDPQMFWQIHRGTLVNVNAIAGVQRGIGGHLQVKLKQRKETLPVSEPYMHLFKSM
jgi:DNA-binding LytR/AlgR family response regulator